MKITKKTKNLIKTSFDNYKFGFKTETKSSYKTPKGLSAEKIKEISKRKSENPWMLDFRLKAFETFTKKPMPTWGPDLTNLDFANIHYYLDPLTKQQKTWDSLPYEISNTFDKLGVIKAEKDFLGGSGAQFESEVIYHNLLKEFQAKGIIFESTDRALKKYPEIFKEYFGKVVPFTDNKFAALNSAAWSGGTFIYVPKNTHVDMPLQAYFRINEESTGQFERTLIIADEGSFVHYIEGCTAPTCSNDSLHAAVVEIIVKKNAKVQYTTIQNWSRNIYNLVTKRAFVYKNGEMIWLDCNLGSKITMKYPAIFLLEEGAKGEVNSLAVAGKGQNIDAGAKIIHAAKNTSSKVISKSISLQGGTATYRGLVKSKKSATGIKNFVSCDALIMDDYSHSNTHPKIDIPGNKAAISHEATVSKINEDQLFYLKSRGINEETAISLIVNGFADNIVKKFPMEYALELSRLLEIETSNIAK